MTSFIHILKLKHMLYVCLRDKDREGVLYSSCLPQTYYVDQEVLEFVQLHLSLAPKFGD